MSLWQKVKGMSKKARAIVISIVLALAVVAGGLATGLSLSNKNSDRIGSDVTAENTAMGTNMTKTAPSKLGNAANSAYRYTPASGQTLSAFQNIPAADVNGSWFIDTPGKWLYAVDRMNAKDSTYLSAKYIFAGGVMDFGGATITPAAYTSTSPFTGTIYGNKTTIQNVTLGSVKDGGAAGSSTGAINYSGFICFAQNANFYDLAFNTNVKFNMPANIHSVCGGLVAQLYGTTNNKFVNIGSFVTINVQNTCAAEVPCYIGGIIGQHLGSYAYFNGCTYCGTVTRRGATTTNADNNFLFGGVFGNWYIDGYTLECYNSSSDFTATLYTTGPCGGPIGSSRDCGNKTLKVKNFVARLNMTNGDSNINSPDYGYLFGNYGNAAKTLFTTNCLFENIYVYGNGGTADSGWLSCVDASGKSVVKNFVTNFGGFANASNPDAVIQQAQNNSAIQQSGVIVNDDGTVGSGNLPAADFTIIYVDQLNTAGLSNGSYNSANGATLPTRTASGATFNGWSVGSWTATPAMSFKGGGRIGDLTVYARYTLNDNNTTKSMTAGSQSQTVTYGTDVTYTVNIVHPQVTAGKAKLVIDGWYYGSSYGTKLTGASGTGTGTYANVTASTSGTTYTLKFTKPTVAQSMTYRLKYTINANSGVNGVATGSGYYDITLKVNKATVTNPTFNTEFTYDTDAHSVIKTAGGSTLYKAGGTTSATDAGNYTATFTLNDAANYKWATTSGLQAGATLPSESGVITVKWTIKQASFNDPTPTDPDNPNPPPTDPGYKPWIGQGEDPDAPEYDPRLDPDNPKYDPKLDPDNPGYDPTIDPRNPKYDPKKDPANPYGDNYDPSKDPRKDPESGGYDPRLDPKAPEYDPKIDPDPDNPGYIPDLDPYDPNSPAYDPDAPSYGGGNTTGSYVKFEVNGTGIVGLSLNNTKNNNGKGLTVTGSAWITYANGKRQDIPGTFSFKSGGEIISYAFFDYNYALENNNQSIYKTIVVFTPNDKSIAPYEREVAIVVIGHYIDIGETKINADTGVELSSVDGPRVWIDYGSVITVAPQIGGAKITISYYDGAVQKTTDMLGTQTPVGFNATLKYRENGNGALISIPGTNNVFSLDLSTIAGATYYEQKFYVGYVPATNTAFTVYYVLEETGRIDDGQITYPYNSSSSAGSLDSNASSGNPVVYKALATGTTTKPVHYLENGQYLTTLVDMGAIADHYELDTNANKYLDELLIKGDGSTYAVVFLKAKYHTVTFLAVGAVENSMQTQAVKYGGKIDPAQVKTPKKNGANFQDWRDADGSVVTFSQVTIKGDVTYYANFDNTPYFIVFDMNAVMADVDGFIPKGAINLKVIPTEMGVGSMTAVRDLIKWNYSSLFASYEADGKFFFATSDDKDGRWSVGDYVFEYTVDSLTKNLSLTSSAVKPSALSYTFVNWYATDNSGNITDTTTTVIRAPKNYSSGTMPETVITVKASWKVQTYTLVFDKQDGSRTTTVSGVGNLSKWTDIYAKNSSLHPDNITRTGYTFAGWYATPECDGLEATTELGTSNYFSVYDYKDLENIDGEYIYKTETSDGNFTYNFSTIRLYAKWKNVEINVGEDDGDDWKNSDGGIIVDVQSDSDEGVYLDYSVTVTVLPDVGYVFSHLVVGKTPRYIYSNGTNTVSFTVYGSDVDFSDPTDPRLELTAVFTPITYTLTYNMNGGSYNTAVGGAVTRTYNVVGLKQGSVELPNALRRLGYNFLGWKFENTNPSLDGEWAIKNGGQSNSDLYGTTIYLQTTGAGNNIYCGDLNLIAVWSAKTAVVKLHNVSYAEMEYSPDPTNTYFEVKSPWDDASKSLYTDDVVRIISPTSTSFVFIGWSTTRGGEVVYAAEADDDAVMYTVKSDYDINGNPDSKANHLYAVWKVGDFDYVVITAEGNGNVYDGNGIKLSAITSKEYEENPEVGSTLSIQYNWYRFDDSGDNKYDNIFEIQERIYIDDAGSAIATVTYGANNQESKWEWESGFDWNTVKLPEGIEKTEENVKDYMRSGAYGYVEKKGIVKNNLEKNCELVSSTTVTGDRLTERVSYVVPNVAMAGQYICVAEVSGSTEGVGIERFGEITVSMPRAEFRGVVFQSKSITYDGLGHSIGIDLTGNDKNIKLENNIITLPDKDNKGNDNKAHISVRYEYKLKNTSITQSGNDGRYYDDAGNLVNLQGVVINADGQPVQEVVNAGIYTVTAYFEVQAYEEHSYDVISNISAELEITQRKLTNVTFGLEHDVDGWTDGGMFVETYDGEAYEIIAKINDTDLRGRPLVDVTNGNISLEVKVYTSPDGMNKGDLVEGNPTNAGTYYAEINKTVKAGVNGDNSANYIVGDITTVQIFVIEKARLDYGLSFKDAEVTFDNKIHTIEVMSNGGKDPLPDMLTATYTQEVTFNEDVSGYYGEDNRCLENNKYYPDIDGTDKTGTVAGNGGRHAGIYDVSVAISFKDPAIGKNYESVAIEPATLTIKKADLIEFYADGETELFGSEFKSATYSYIVSANQMKYVSSTILDGKDASDTPYFTVYYTVSRKMDSGSFVAVYTGTRAELEAKQVSLNLPGTYKIDAEVVYNTPVYKNNFENVDVQTIEIVINDSVIENIEIVFTEAAYKDGVSHMVQYVGETFNPAYFDRIVITYEGGADNKLIITGTDLDPANGVVKVIYDKSGTYTSFWNVGEAIALTFELYGKEATTDATIKILDKVAQETVDLMYSVNGSSYSHVPEDGLNIEEISAPESVYAYRLYFQAKDEKGDTVTTYVDITIEDTTKLVRGENVLKIGIVGLYDFSDVLVTLNAYKLIELDDVAWKYSTDGREWKELGEDATLPYIAQVYYVGVAFMGEDGNEVVAVVIPETGNILHAGEYALADSELYTNDRELYEIRNRYYRINNVNLGIPLTVAQHELKLTWENVMLKYTGDVQTVNLKNADVFAEDVEDVVLEYSYYKLTKNSDGSVEETKIGKELIVNAGDYRIRVTGVTVADGADAAKAGNYSIPENNFVDFTINKASIAFEKVYYLESGKDYSYGDNTSYQNNPQGLRTDKMYGIFGSNTAVEGDFYFVVYDTDTDGYVILSDVEAGQLYLQTTGTRQVKYIYSPLDMKNYNVFEGTLTINVKAQTRTNNLRVVRKTGAAPFYIVDSVVAPDRFDVFETYASFYIEDGVEYGKFEPLTTYRVEANGNLITDQYKYKVKASDSKIVITVYHSSNTNINGTLEFAVYQSQPIGLKLDQYEIDNKIKPVWYVGESFALDVEGPNAVEFKLLFEGGDEASLSFYEMNFTVDGVGFNERDSRFTSAGVATITFNYAGFTCELELVIKPKEDLVITTPQTKTVKYEEGKEQDVPVLEFLLDGETVKQEDIEGVEYTYEIMRLDGTNALTPTDKILEEGTYVVIYYFEITNPRFNTPNAFRLTVNVKSIAYQAIWEEFKDEELTSVYDGKKIEPPTARVSKVKDLIYEREYYNGWTVEVIKTTRENESQQCDIISAGRYTVTAQATYNGEDIGIIEYTYTVTQAENSATIIATNVVIGDDISEKVGYGKNVTVDLNSIKFGAETFDPETMIAYSRSEYTGFSTTEPTEVGTWYVRLEIPGTSDYAKLTVIAKFNINQSNVGSIDRDEEGNLLGDVVGGASGLIPSAVLDVKKVGEDALAKTKIKNNKVYEGYDVRLIDSTKSEEEGSVDIQLTEPITLRLLLSSTELRGLDESKIRVYRVTVDAKGRIKTEAVNAKVSEDGKYLVLEGVRDLGRFVITEKLNTVPVGLLVGVIVCAVIAAGLIVACVLVFLKKREII